MPNTPRQKLFYPIDEVCSRLGLTLLEWAVLVAEGELTLCTAVPGLRVQTGEWEHVEDGRWERLPGETVYVRGLIDLRPEDAWHVLRSGSQLVNALPAEEGRYRHIVGRHEDDLGYTVIREEIGVRHEELRRYEALDGAKDVVAFGPRPGVRGSLPRYDWDAARLEACRHIYFEGVPESYGALIRHIQAWFTEKGGPVPDESTLKRRLRDIWATFGSEGKPQAA